MVFMARLKKDPSTTVAIKMMHKVFSASALTQQLNLYTADEHKQHFHCERYISIAPEFRSVKLQLCQLTEQSNIYAVHVCDSVAPGFKSVKLQLCQLTEQLNIYAVHTCDSIAPGFRSVKLQLRLLRRR